MINAKFPDQSYWSYDRASHAKVGYSTDPSVSWVRYRSIFDFDTTAWRGKHVLGAVFSANLVHSWSCSNSTTELHLTPAVDQNTTWNNHSGSWGGSLSGVSDSDCGDATVYTEWGGLTGVVQQSTGWSTITLGLRATDEATIAGWKKFDEGSAKLSVTYNSVPNVPDQLTIDGKPCGSGPNRAYVSTLGGHDYGDLCPGQDLDQRWQAGYIPTPPDQPQWCDAHGHGTNPGCTPDKPRERPLPGTTCSAASASAGPGCAPPRPVHAAPSNGPADAYTLPHGEHGEQLYGDCPRDPHGNAVYTANCTVLVEYADGGFSIDGRYVTKADLGGVQVDPRNVAAIIDGFKSHALGGQIGDPGAFTAAVLGDAIITAALQQAADAAASRQPGFWEQVGHNAMATGDWETALIAGAIDQAWQYTKAYAAAGNDPGTMGAALADRLHSIFQADIGDPQQFQHDLIDTFIPVDELVTSTINTLDAAAHGDFYTAGHHLLDTIIYGTAVAGAIATIALPAFAEISLAAETIDMTVADVQETAAIGRTLDTFLKLQVRHGGACDTYAPPAGGSLAGSDPPAGWRGRVRCSRGRRATSW